MTGALLDLKLLLCSSHLFSLSRLCRSIHIHVLMGFRFPRLSIHGKQMLIRQNLTRNRPAPAASDVPGGHFAVYVGEPTQIKRFVVPISFLKKPFFRCLLEKSEEEFGFHHPRGGLTIPCNEDVFLALASDLRHSASP